MSYIPDYIKILQDFDQVFIEEKKSVISFYDEKGKEYTSYFVEGLGKYGFWIPKNFKATTRYVDFFNTHNNNVYVNKIYRYRAIKIEEFVATFNKIVRHTYQDKKGNGEKGWYVDILIDIGQPEKIFN